MKPKPTKNRRPWNRVNQQVYSLSTCDSKGNINMNIVTYATPATLKPKSYVIAVYHGTKTHANLFNKPNTHFLLQGLSSAQTNQIRTLGQKSGLKYDKAKIPCQTKPAVLRAQQPKLWLLARLRLCFAL